MDLLLPNTVKSDIKKRTGCVESTIECYEVTLVLGKRFKALKDNYAKLYAELDKFHPKHVILTEYPNLTKDDGGAYCGDEWLERLSLSHLMCPSSLFRSMIPFGITLNGAGLDQKEAEFVDRQIINKLNEIGKTSIDSAKDGFHDEEWRYASGIYRSSSDRAGGYCSCNPWFLTVVDSNLTQGEPGKDTTWWIVTTGAAHPNIIGQCHYADEILSALDRGRSEACDGTSWVVGGHAE